MALIRWTRLYYTTLGKKDTTRLFDVTSRLPLAAQGEFKQPSAKFLLNR